MTHSNNMNSMHPHASFAPRPAHFSTVSSSLSNPQSSSTNNSDTRTNPLNNNDSTILTSTASMDQLLDCARSEDSHFVIKSTHERANSKYRIVKARKQSELRYKIVAAERSGDKATVKVVKKKNDNHASAVASRFKQDYIVKEFENVVKTKISQSNEIANAYIAQSMAYKSLEAKYKDLHSRYRELSSIHKSVMEERLASKANSTINITNQNNNSCSCKRNMNNNITNSNNHNSMDLSCNVNCTNTNIESEFNNESTPLVSDDIDILSSHSSSSSSSYSIFEMDSNPNNQIAQLVETMAIPSNETIFKSMELNSWEPLPSSVMSQRQALVKGDSKNKGDASTPAA